MDSGLSTVRNLLYIVLVLALLAVAINIYVGTQLSENSEELSRLGLLLQKQLMTSATEQSQQLQQKMDKLDQDAAGIDQKMQAGEDHFVRRMNDELPKTMDRYVQSRAPRIERQVLKQMPPQ